MATAAVLLSTACSDDSTAPTSTGLEALRSETPQASPEREALTRVTRLVALAMGDQGLRQRIKNDMRKAPFREHKLELSNYLHGASGGILLAKMAKEGDLPRAEVLALLAQVRPLEFYMPLARDRATWTGGAEVIVASLLEDNGPDTIPAGFTIDGRAYPLTASEPPPVPVLTLVPVETDFSTPLSAASVQNTDDVGGQAIGNYQSATASFNGDCGPYALQECDSESGGGGGGINWSLQPAGIFLTSDYINDLGESWTKGAPELEIFTARRDLADQFNRGMIVRCVSERFSGDRAYQQDDHDFSGAVLIGDQVQLNALPANQGLMFIMYEDDDTTCEIKDETDALQNTVNFLKAAQSGRDGFRKAECGYLCKAVVVGETAISLITNAPGVVRTNDDLVGELRMESCSKNGRTGTYKIYKETALNGCANLKAN